MRADEFIGACSLGIIIWIVVMGLVICPPVRSLGFNEGLKAAVACSPGVFLQNLDSGEILCVGGNKETWIVSGR